MGGYFSDMALDSYRSLVSELQGEDFSEGAYDFTRCVRPDGSSYGTGGKCRKGIEESRDKSESLKKRGVKPAPAEKAGMRITAKIKALSVNELEKVAQDPRLKGFQKEILKKIIDEKRGTKKPAAVSVQPPAKPPKQVPEVKQSKFSDERIKKAFNRALAKFERAKGHGHGITMARHAVDVLRQSYHAMDRDAFLKATGEVKKFKTQAARDKMKAAFYGEPIKLSKPVSDGGGKVNSAVPPSLPRGGADPKLKEFLDGSEVVMAFHPKGFAKFVKEGEAKNGFQKGTGGIKTGRSGYLAARRNGESTTMDIPPTTDPKGRPMYAALEHPDRSRSLQGAEPQMSQYGGIQVVFNNSVKDRSTFTVGDSLDYNTYRQIKASPVRDPADPQSVNNAGREKIDIEIKSPNSQSMKLYTPSIDGWPVTPPYVEAQIHGGLRASEIKEVRYYSGHEITAATRSLLEKQGVKIVKLPPKMEDLEIYPDSPNFKDITAIKPPK